MQDRIEIIELGLDEKFLEEIEGEMKVSDEIKIKIKGHLDGMKRQTVNKKEHRQKKWEGKLDIIFNILKESYDNDPKSYVPKTTIIEALSCEEKEFSPTMQKFKKYLRTTKEDKWSISKKRLKGVSSYALVPFG
jgi:metal-dependent HD superfamily phosphatase/phosphodiesterase